MRKFKLLTTILIAALFAGCSNDLLVQESGSIIEESTKAGTIRLTATMPGDNGTRVALSEDESRVYLNWQEGDELHLIFVENGVPVGKTTIEVTGDNISNKAGTASFDITVDGVTGDTFDLYGVHGGNGFSTKAGEEYELLLPTIEQSTGGSLEELSANNAIMIKFEAKNVSTESPNISVNFEHMGSLFKLELTNELGTAIPDTHFDVDLVGKDEASIYAFQNTNNNASYNPVSNTFYNWEYTNRLPLGRNIPTNGDIPNEGTFDSWGWYIPNTGLAWPELSLSILNIDQIPEDEHGNPILDENGVPLGPVTFNSTNSKAARTAPTAIGKAFIFYATFDGHLYFTNAKSTFTDSRDGSIYSTVKLGTLEWMAQNLRYMPDTGLGTDYMAHEGDNAAEKLLDYGVYYSWETAKTACPPGWRLPTNMEFISLFSGDNAAAFKAAGNYHWNTDNGDNSNGFNAYGGGYFYDNGGSYDITEFKELAAWWSSAEDGTVHQIVDKKGDDDAPGFKANDFDKDLSFVNVRCIRDTSSGGGVDH